VRVVVEDRVARRAALRGQLDVELVLPVLGLAEQPLLPEEERTIAGEGGVPLPTALPLVVRRVGEADVRRQAVPVATAAERDRAHVPAREAAEGIEGAGLLLEAKAATGRRIARLVAHRAAQIVGRGHAE